jgi:hypothetical protein
VEALEDSCLDFTEDYATIEALLKVLQSRPQIANVVLDPKTGDWLLYLTGEENPLVLKNGTKGADGKGFDPSLIALKDSAGGKYWNYDGETVKGVDGKPLEYDAPKVENDDPTKVNVPFYSVDPNTGLVIVTYDTEYDPTANEGKGAWVVKDGAKWNTLTDENGKSFDTTGPQGKTGPSGDPGVLIGAPYLYTFVSDNKYLVFVLPGDYYPENEKSLIFYAVDVATISIVQH